MSVPRTSVPGRSRRLVAVLVVAVLAVVGTAAVALTQRGDDRRTGVAADVLEPPAPPEVAAQLEAAGLTVHPGRTIVAGAVLADARAAATLDTPRPAD